jgi:hypothetical protein
MKAKILLIGVLLIAAVSIPSVVRADNVAQDAHKTYVYSHADCYCGQQISLGTSQTTDRVRITGLNQHNYRVSQWVWTPPSNWVGFGPGPDATWTDVYGSLWHGRITLESWWKGGGDNVHIATSWCDVPTWALGYSLGRYTFYNCQVAS